ncbi:hypothetical protein DFJ74DRAFT_661861 [Hyaloraphidium curvatum]|nr:hypothetical protein DFJ74DRAFT_661861 [Hyaloraphidium curvatum]
MDGMVRAAAEAAASNLMPRLSTWKGNTEFIEDCARCIGQVLKSLDAGAGGGEYRDLYASLSRGDAESVFQKHPHLRWESLPDIQMTPSELVFAATPFHGHGPQVQALPDGRRAATERPTCGTLRTCSSTRMQRGARMCPGGFSDRRSRRRRRGGRRPRFWTACRR